MPDVSIIIPNYNGGSFLREAIDSVFAQGAENFSFEIIVVDDGSTDDSRAIIESYGHRICPVFQTNQGACAARNAGLAAAGGTFIKFLDSDDYLMPGVLEEQFEQARAVPASIIVFGDCVLVDQFGEQLEAAYYPDVADGTVLSAEALIQRAPLTSMALFPVAALRAVKGFDPEMPAGQEYDLQVRLYFAGYGFLYRKMTIYAYRQHQAPDRISTKRHSQQSFEKRFDGYQRHLRFATEYYQEQIPAVVNTAFAHIFWTTGRFALRCSHPSIAQRYFKEAKQLSPRNYCPGSGPYCLLVRCCGPRLAERIAGFL